jgi:hypothetical protein
MIDMQLDKHPVDCLFVGIDVNLTGLAVAVLGWAGLELKWFAIHHDKMHMGELVPRTVNEIALECHRACKWAFLFIKKEKMINQVERCICAIEDPTGMGVRRYKDKKTGQSKIDAGAQGAASFLNKLVGMLSMVFLEAEFEISTPSSVIWKSEVLGVGMGQAEKKDVQIFISEKYTPGHYIENHHLADALSLADYCVLQRMKEESR